MQSSANSTVANISSHASSIGEDMEFDFELCHMQYSYCCCWRYK